MCLWCIPSQTIPWLRYSAKRRHDEHIAYAITQYIGQSIANFQQIYCFQDQCRCWSRFLARMRSQQRNLFADRMRSVWFLMHGIHMAEMPCKSQDILCVSRSVVLEGLVSWISFGRGELQQPATASHNKYWWTTRSRNQTERILILFFCSTAASICGAAKTLHLSFHSVRWRLWTSRNQLRWHFGSCCFAFLFSALFFLFFLHLLCPPHSTIFKTFCRKF